MNVTEICIVDYDSDKLYLTAVGTFLLKRLIGNCIQTSLVEDKEFKGGIRNFSSVFAL